MNKIASYILLLPLLLSSPAQAAHALPAPDAPPVNQPNDPRREKMRAHWNEMSPAEKDKMRVRMQRHWDETSEQERALHRQKMRDRWDKMSPAEREKFRHEMKR